MVGSLADATVAGLVVGSLIAITIWTTLVVVFCLFKVMDIVAGGEP